MLEGVKALALALLVCILPMAAQERGQKTALPRFEDYPVDNIFQGTPVAPKIVTPLERLYRTRIREGVQKGWGVDREGKEDVPGPNFAGRYIVIRWGCGSPCIMMVVVDASTGNVLPPPISDGLRGPSVLTLPLLIAGDSAPWPAKIEFHLNSRLLIARATPCLKPLPSPSYTYYFLLEQNEWHLLKKVPLVRAP